MQIDSDAYYRSSIELNFQRILGLLTSKGLNYRSNTDLLKVKGVKGLISEIDKLTKQRFGINTNLYLTDDFTIDSISPASFDKVFITLKSALFNLKVDEGIVKDSIKNIGKGLKFDKVRVVNKNLYIARLPKDVYTNIEFDLFKLFTDASTDIDKISSILDNYIYLVAKAYANTANNYRLYGVISKTTDKDIKNKLGNTPSMGDIKKEVEDTLLDTKYVSELVDKFKVRFNLKSVTIESMQEKLQEVFVIALYVLMYFLLLYTVYIIFGYFFLLLVFAGTVSVLKALMTNGRSEQPKAGSNVKGTLKEGSKKVTDTIQSMENKAGDHGPLYEAMVMFRGYAIGSLLVNRLESWFGKEKDK